MIKRTIITLVSLLLLSTAFAQSKETSKPNAEVYSVVKLFLEGPEQLNLMAVADIDFDHIHGDIQKGVELTLTKKDVLKLSELGITYEVLIDDYAKFYEKRRLKELANLPADTPKKVAANFSYGSMGGFYTWAEIQTELDNMHNLFPNIATQKFSIGTSVEGRTIWAIKISDNPNVDESEPVAYYDALHHAREPLAMAATMNYMFWLLENYGTDPEVTYIIDNRELYFVPCVNPDGYEYNRSTNPNGGGLWRKNRRGGYGVDLNRNYSYQWGYNSSCASSSTGSATYKGPTPFSEPEAVAVRDFVASIGATVGFSTHSTAGYHLMPTGFGSPSPPEFDVYSEWASDFLSENDYAYGTTQQMLGYTSCGTTRDYLHNSGVYAWTPEIGGSGFWPAQSEIFPRVDENIYPFFYQAWIAGGYADVQSHEVIGNAVAGSTFQMQVEVKNKGAGAASNNVTVELVPSSTLVTTSGSVSYGTIAARAKADNAANLFDITVDPNYNQGAISIDIVVSQEGTESRTETITVNIGNKTILFEDDAEAGSSNWSSAGNGTTWGVNMDDSYGGFQSFGDSNGGNITGNTNSRFTLDQAISLTGLQDPYVEYFAKWSIGPGDYINLQASTNGSSWTTIATHVDSESWIERKISLAPFIGGNVYLRYNLVTTSGIKPDGFYFDDFAVTNYVCPTCPVCNTSIATFPYQESFETGLNDWTQGTADNINWTRNTGGTPSSNTGPSGAEDGSFYMYIEASDPNYPDIRADLISPCYDLTSSNSASIAFAYHMNGNNMGDLYADVSIDNGNSWTEDIWSSLGNKGSAWQAATIDLQNYLGEFVTVRFRGITGSSYDSDIAIDNVTVTATQGSCPIGSTCDDGDVCTSGSTYDSNCGCTGGTFQDTDNDGVCDTNDLCPNFDDTLIGTPCDDGIVCTTGETYDTNCGCSGGISQDTDGDGVCDEQDLCPNFDDALIGTLCDDGESCTTGETYDTNCGCSGGTTQDTDSDGICDANDPCPTDPQNLCVNPCNNSSVAANAGPDLSFCEGELVQLSSTGNGSTYEWSPMTSLSNPFIANPTASPSTTTNYTLTVTDTDGCTATDEVTLTPIALPIVLTNSTTDATTGQSDGSITITFDDAPEVTTISFSLDGGNTWEANLPDAIGSVTYSNLPAGTYDLWTRNANGLCATDIPDATINNQTVIITPPCTSGGINTSYEFIEGVSVGTINNNSGSDNGYADYTALSTDVEAGQAYTINLVPGFANQSYNEYWTVKADFDGNGDFDGANETLLSTSSSAQIVEQITIPTGVSAGNFTMRVAMQYNSSPPSCGNFTYGEVEDYTLVINAACAVGMSCDDGNSCTTNDSFDANCNCVGVPATDTDNDGVCDANDVCPNFDDNLIGTPCNDNDACTTGETYDTNCGCSGGTTQDSDNDGICDDLDQCPGSDDNLIGTSCDDNDSCTIGDIYTTNCNCVGTPDSDSDNDGVCDANDVCPNFDDNLIGTPCNDNDACTTGETYDTNCGCSGGTTQDSDNDGICDNLDQCPNLDDNLIGTSCDDNDSCTIGDIYTTNCNCAGTPDSDSDNDGVCDANDVCPNFDDNLIGTPCNDNDACTTGETYDSNCGCSGGTTQDSDNDGICDDLDQCPNLDDNLIGTSCDDNDSCTIGDIYTTNCNCAGTPDSDSDNDGVCDANDVCPNFDDNLIGTPCNDNDACTTGETYDTNCGCSGGTTQDSDNDGICDNLDQCPNLDDNLIGTSCNDNDSCTIGDIYTTNCNCAGTPDSDSDNDGVCDANDVCPNFDDNLIGAPCNDNDACTTGETYDTNCGCSGGTTQDSDNDGICDDLDQCPGSDDNIDLDNNGIPDGCQSCPTYNFNTDPILAYDPGQDLGNFNIQDAGATVYMENNSWKALDISYDVTPNTVISFDFKSTIEGEIHEVSFDNNLSLAPAHRIVIYGNQGYNGDYAVGTYNLPGEWQNFTIPIGTYFTGSFQYLVLTADDDNQVVGNSYFRDVSIFEDSNGDLTCDSECTPGAACDDGDPCTAGETYDALCGCTGGQATADSDNDGICDSLDQCPNFDDNLIGTSCNDNDPCTTGETYDANCGCSDGTVIDFDNDGFCAANDPDDNDSCVPDDSNCSGCQTYDFNDFENGLGIWNDGGNDAAVNGNQAAYANSGSVAARIRDNSGSQSSIFTDDLDLSAFGGVDFSFSFIPNSMETNEDFFLEVSSNGGNSFTIVEEWNSGIEMTNNVRQDVTVNVPGTFLSNATVFRLRCDASTNSDRVYIDDILIETCGTSFGSKPVLKRISPITNGRGTLTVYPNPAQNNLFLELNDYESSKMKNAKVISSFGKLIKIFDINQKKYTRLDISDLKSGQAYLIIIETEDGTSFIEKFIKL